MINYSNFIAYFVTITNSFVVTVEDFDTSSINTAAA